MKGILLINKPPGLTSHNIVNALRKISGIKKIGHAGTLDPFAQGLLILLVGREATKLSRKFLFLDKNYKTTFVLGKISDTDDLTGKIEKAGDKKPTKEKIEKTLKSFQGKIIQTIPLYSAKKIKGKKLYELARKRKKIILPKKEVFIHNIKILNYQYPKLSLKVKCSSGTYIRSIARDLGKKLETGAYVEKLVRENIGNFSLHNAVSLDKINPQNWQNFLLTLP